MQSARGMVLHGCKKGSKEEVNRVLSLLVLLLRLHAAGKSSASPEAKPTSPRMSPSLALQELVAVISRRDEATTEAKEELEEKEEKEEDVPTWTCQFCSLEVPESLDTNKCPTCENDKGAWKCGACTFANDDSASSCKICESARPDIPKKVSKLSAKPKLQKGPFRGLSGNSGDVDCVCWALVERAIDLAVEAADDLRCSPVLLRFLSPAFQQFTQCIVHHPSALLIYRVVTCRRKTTPFFAMSPFFCVFSRASLFFLLFS